MKNVFITLVFGCLIAAPACSQGVAIRYIMGETHKVYKRPKFDNYCMGIGVDRTFNERFTAGLDISYDLAHLLRPEIGLYSDNINGAGNYVVRPKLLSLNYHTEFALADNDGVHTYIGTFIGLRHITQTWTLQDNYGTSGYLDNQGFSPLIKVSEWLVPVGLRLGLRGTTDGGFVDFYAAVGYQIGGGDQLVTRSLYRSTEGSKYAETSSLALTFGLAYGFGW